MSADDAQAPAWIFGEVPEPDELAVALYLDGADPVEPVAPALQLWYDLIAGLVVPAFTPPGVTPKVVLYGREGVHGRGPTVRAKRWQDGLNDRLWWWSATWSYEIPEPYQPYEIQCRLHRLRERRHVRLRLFVSSPSGTQHMLLPAVLEVLRRFGDAADPAYGELTVRDHAPDSCTKLDGVLRLLDTTSADASRAQLRGYEWATVIPAELTARLGGVDALRATGAFVEVTALATGGVLARATEHPQEYTADRAEQVFAALLPVLPPPDPDWPACTDWRLIVPRPARAW
ncbi:hypothetical protein [Dactylosporangium sp. CA-233914]|uniref:hypothetical protein n=1 Tax=Dactylosporangium sp. CA-233914 TaxID=3239934 RepID=UPI003D92E1D3